MTSTGPIGSLTRTTARPLPTRPALGPGILTDWVRRNREATLPHTIEQLVASGTIDNLRRLVGERDAPYRGMVFQDSDLFKTLEAVAWELGRADDARLRDFFDDSVALLARVQREDGYLNSYHQRDDRPREPWTDLRDAHELYCLGHLIQAAVAASRAMGDDRLLAIARRFADLAVERFGAPDAVGVCGHPEIETALVELARLTGHEAYLALAVAFIDRRGHGTLGADGVRARYYQDDVPVRDTDILRGHAVRALYLDAGVTDAWAETGDAALLASMERQWTDLVYRRMYLTGGTGSRHRDESFGDAFELPSDRAYAETCAGIALMHWAWRMFLATGRADVLDVFERCLYNVVAAGIDADGTAFCYSNPLQRRPDHGGASEEDQGARLGWFACACCPPNLARLFGSIEHYLAATADGAVLVANYASARFTAPTASGEVELELTTDYPADGRVAIAVVRGDSDAELRLRVPAWATGATVLRDGAAVGREVDGWLIVDGALHEGVELTLDLPMRVRATAGHPDIGGVGGAVAVERGPVVYCAEQADNAADVELVRLPVGRGPLVAEIETGGTAAGAGALLAPSLRVAAEVRDAPDVAPLYREWGSDTASWTPAELVLRPYARWGDPESGGGYRVWLAAG